MKKILLILPLAALLAAGCNTQSTVNVQPQNTANNQNSSQESATQEPTANWKTYTNDKYGFSLQYPSDWQLSFDDAKPATPGNSALSFTVWIRKVTGNASYQDIQIRDNLKFVSKGTLESNVASIAKFYQQPKTIDIANGKVIYEEQDLGGAAGAHFVGDIVSATNNYFFTAIEGTPEQDIVAILSTFKIK